MKKYLNIILATALLAASCETSGTDDAALQPENTLYATVETQTRTQLGELSDSGYKHLWSKGDEIGVFIDGSTQAARFTLIEGAGESNASFSGSGRGTEYVAVYPYNRETELLGGGKVKIGLPAVQSYAEGTFASGSFPMIAASGSSQLQFKNLCAVLKVPVTGSMTIDRVTVTPNDPTIAVAGTATVDYASGDAPQLTIAAADGVSSVSVSCPGLHLAKDVPTDFYIVVPAQTYKGGFTVTISSPGGEGSRSFTSDIVMARSEMRALKTPIDYDSIFDGMLPSDHLEGDGSEANPFRIGSAADLLLMQMQVNGEDDGAASAHYLLTGDIDLAEYNEKAGSWSTIGNPAGQFEFNGVFDGGGHTIDNLVIDNDDTVAGLFGRLSGAVVRNLCVSGTVKAGSKAGLIAGEVSESVIDGCSTTETSSVSATSYVGGLAGYLLAGSEIRNSHNRAAVTGGSCAGGLAGYSAGRIANSVNTGTVSGTSAAGGIVGRNAKGASGSGEVLNSLNVSSMGGSAKDAGAICGANESTARYCYWLHDAASSKGFAAGCGETTGVFSDCSALTLAELAGADTGRKLYTDRAGIFSYVEKALNAWAYDNGGAAAKYAGWKMSSAGDVTMPELSGTPELPEPDMDRVSQTLFISISADSFTLPVLTSFGAASTGLVEWGDGSTGDYSAGAAHTYATDGGYTVTVDADAASEVLFETLSGVTEVDFSQF